MNLDWLFDLIPVPERSGLQDAVCSVVMLFSLVSGAGGEDPFCGIMPWKCTTHAQEDRQPGKGLQGRTSKTVVGSSQQHNDLVHPITLGVIFSLLKRRHWYVNRSVDRLGMEFSR